LWDKSGRHNGGGRGTQAARSELVANTNLIEAKRSRETVLISRTGPSAIESRPAKRRLAAVRRCRSTNRSAAARAWDLIDALQSAAAKRLAQFNLDHLEGASQFESLNVLMRRFVDEAARAKYLLNNLAEYCSPVLRSAAPLPTECGEILVALDGELEEMRDNAAEEGEEEPIPSVLDRARQTLLELKQTTAQIEACQSGGPAVVTLIAGSSDWSALVQTADVSLSSIFNGVLKSGARLLACRDSEGKLLGCCAYYPWARVYAVLPRMLHDYGYLGKVAAAALPAGARPDVSRAILDALVLHNADADGILDIEGNTFYPCSPEWRRVCSSKPIQLKESADRDQVLWAALNRLESENQALLQWCSDEVVQASSVHGLDDREEDLDLLNALGRQLHQRVNAGRFALDCHGTPDGLSAAFLSRLLGEAISPEAEPAGTAGATAAPVEQALDELKEFSGVLRTVVHQVLEDLRSVPIVGRARTVLEDAPSSSPEEELRRLCQQLARITAYNAFYPESAGTIDASASVERPEEFLYTVLRQGAELIICRDAQDEIAGYALYLSDRDAVRHCAADLAEPYRHFGRAYHLCSLVARAPDQGRQVQRMLLGAVRLRCPAADIIAGKIRDNDVRAWVAQIYGGRASLCAEDSGNPARFSWDEYCREPVVGVVWPVAMRWVVTLGKNRDSLHRHKARVERIISRRCWRILPADVQRTLRAWRGMRDRELYWRSVLGLDNLLTAVAREYGAADGPGDDGQPRGKYVPSDLLQHLQLDCTPAEDLRENLCWVLPSAARQKITQLRFWEQLRAGRADHRLFAKVREVVRKALPSAKEIYSWKLKRAWRQQETLTQYLERQHGSSQSWDLVVRSAEISDWPLIFACAEPARYPTEAYEG
jgi:hypothetical protein